MRGGEGESERERERVYWVKCFGVCDIGLGAGEKWEMRVDG